MSNNWNDNIIWALKEYLGFQLQTDCLARRNSISSIRIPTKECVFQPKIYNTSKEIIICNWYSDKLGERCRNASWDDLVIIK